MEGRTIPTLTAELADHVSIASRLAERPPPAPFRGAVNRAAVAAYRLAATEASSEAAHADKVAALRRFVAIVEPSQGSFRAALVDAALAAEVDVRVARGATIHGRRLSGWVDPPASAPQPPQAARPAAGRAAASEIPCDVMRACSEAEGLDDVDAVLLRILELTRRLKVAARLGQPRQALLDGYETAALGLCVRPAPPGADDARFLLLHCWALLRRKRPLAAAVIRARVRWTRTARARGR